MERNRGARETKWIYERQRFRVPHDTHGERLRIGNYLDLIVCLRVHWLVDRLEI